MIIKKSLSLLYIASLTIFIAVLSYSQDQSSYVKAFVSPDINAWEIPAMTLSNVMIEFNGFPMGPITLDDINSAFPGSTIISISYDTVDETDTYDFLSQGGNALVPNPDGTGTLYIVEPPPPNQPFGKANSGTIVLGSTTTEFGFQLGDFSDDFVAEFMLGDQFVARITLFNINSNTTRFVQTKKPFNTVILRPSEGDETGWALPALYLATGERIRPIPTLSEWGLIAMVGSLGALGILYAARKRRYLSKPL